jgi:hypothetical protein
MSPARILVLCFCLLSFEINFALPRSGQESGPGEVVQNARIRELKLQDQTLLDALALLSYEDKRLRFGFEEVLKDRFSDPPIANPRLSVDLENKTIRQVLDALCEMDPRYAWSSDAWTINVYPRATVSDPSYLLNRKLGRLELRAVTDIQQPLLAISQQLPPPREQIALVQMGGDLSYPPDPWNSTFTDTSVRKVVNRIADRLGPRGSWIFSGSRDFRQFSFYKAAFEGLKSQQTP